MPFLNRLAKALILIGLVLFLAASPVEGAAPPARLLLKPSDLPKGYKRFQPGTVCNRQPLVSGFFVNYQPSLRQRFAAHGYVGTCYVAFSQTGGNGYVGGAIEKFTRKEGAHWDYAFNVEEGPMLPGESQLPVPRPVVMLSTVGDESMAYSYRLSVIRPHVWMTLQFRRGRYFVDVTVRGSAARLNNLLRLGRVIDARIRGNG